MLHPGSRSLLLYLPVGVPPAVFTRGCPSCWLYPGVEVSCWLYPGVEVLLLFNTGGSFLLFNTGGSLLLVISRVEVIPVGRPEVIHRG